jgi:hypothetical protein
MNETSETGKPSSNSEHDPVAIVVTRRVKPGREKDYEDWFQDITAVAKQFKGHLGATLIRPTSADDKTYHVIVKYDSLEHLQHWQQSEERRKMYERAKPLTGDPVSEETLSTETLSGLETWFGKPGRPAPATYKMAFLTWLAVFPVATIFNLFLVPKYLQWLPPLGRSFVVSTMLVLLLSYVLLPLLRRLFDRWLFPQKSPQT